MKKEVGLWIDHRKAIIVTVTDKGEEIKKITAQFSEDVKPSGGWDAHSQRDRDTRPENIQDRRFTSHLDKYYDEVVSFIRDAESILILGPGEAKGELKRRIEKQRLGGEIVGVETADEMTEPQIAAKVRQHFGK